ncbi:molybdopterin-dependent oxidoreductase [Rugamonas apoptosis]|uniref:Molybdopterin-dependent oxidoreductase n=1 Tax=Rugamonas apoptosis TaxID=2758570 RepID=A0A7W2FEP8_9BURK|nr:molybdopterin-dependent oxidoreductase [Rugamonas apoptosis]MBA5690219.1 molybdopterin-dependent oxidoreductase [Rugamonas apoptosis]
MRQLIFSLLTAAFGLGQPALAENKPANPAALVTTSVAVTGAVEHPLHLTVADLRRLPAAQLGDVPLICQSGANMGKLEHVRGVRLRDLLDQASIAAPGHHDLRKTIVVAKASDGYLAIFSWNELYNAPLGNDVLVYFEKEGKPLDDDEGRIAMVSSGDVRTGPRHVKWLQSVEVRRIAD